MSPVALCLSLAVSAGLAVPPPVLFAGVEPARGAALQRAIIASTPNAIAIGADEPTPGAGSLPPELVELKARAQAAFDEADLTSAADAGRKLVSGIEARLAQIGDVTPLVDARLALASTYLALEEKLLARAELDAVARMRPALDLDLKVWPPAVVEAFNAAKASVNAEPPARLALALQPRGAVVFVDGVRVGTSPAEVSLKKGPHLVWMGATGHRAQVKLLDVEAGSNTRLDDALAPEPIAAPLSALRAELQAAGRREEAVASARALATAAGASGVVVSGLAKGPEGDVLLLAVVEGDRVRTGAVTLPIAASEDAVRALVAAPSLQVSDASRAALALDFESRLLGFSSAAGPQVAQESVFASPWTWGAIGAGALVVAGAAGAALLLLNQPVVEQGPAQTRVVVVAVQ